MKKIVVLLMLFLFCAWPVMAESLERDIGRMEGKIDAIISLLNDSIKDREKLETKVAILKEKVDKHSTTWAIIGYVLTGITAIVVFLLSHLIYNWIKGFKVVKQTSAEPSGG